MSIGQIKTPVYLENNTLVDHNGTPLSDRGVTGLEGGSVDAAAVVAAVATMSDAQTQTMRTELVATTWRPVANAAARLALTAEQIEPGGGVRENDTGFSYRLLAAPASNSGNWERVVKADEVLAIAVLGGALGSSATQAPTHSAVTAALAAIGGGGGGGGGQVRPLKPAAVRTMPAGGGTNYGAARVTVPGGLVGANGAVMVFVTTAKSGATDGVACNLRVRSGVSTDYSNYSTAAAVATFNHGASGRGLNGWTVLYGNGTDQSSIKTAQSSGVDWTTNGNTVGNYVAPSVNTASDWEILFGGNCGATDTVTIEELLVVVFNPDAAAGGTMTAAAIEASLDAYYGSTDWRTGGSAAGWQTVTPIAPDSTPVALTYLVTGAAKPNIILNPPVSASHVVQPCADAPDGASYEILLKGGGAAGLWQAYSSGAPTTHGFVWLSGAAPTSPASALYATRILVRRRGYRHEADVAGYDVEL